MFRRLSSRVFQNTLITSKTKVVCTIGPASSSPEVLERMITAGLDCVRFNFSHDTRESHMERFAMVRSVGKKLNRHISILCDIQGPKIRVGTMSKPIVVHPGDEIRVTSESIIGDEKRIQISYPNIHLDLVVGDKIFINDGIIDLIVIDKDKTDLLCRAVSGGIISTKKGCNMPSGNLSIEILSDKDKKDLELIAKLDPEFVAISFVGTGSDVAKVRQFMKSVGNPNIKLISKIERPTCIPNLEGILQESDGIMVARGDLGVEIPVEQVPTVQKLLVKEANRRGKFCIIATQMMESMIENSRPTRAEANDVYNAVLDGTDAVMLSGETSVGKDPVNVVRVMDTIVNEAEKHLPLRNASDFDSGAKSIVEAHGHSLYSLANEFESFNWKGKFLLFSKTGHLARMVAKYRPPMPIIVLSASERTVREMSLVWAVRSLLISQSDMDNHHSVNCIRLAETEGLIDSSDTHVVVMWEGETGQNMQIIDLERIRSK